ncbi:MAG: hypothetical protein JW744_01310 [Candidatus Diapherotrites archaeon]|uniref:Uncharacterized protein n=1 Tax=Candidatus Iainarchaeum sp. TaxID=3101447 RepID=A0A939C9W0_9ARCH|nr:hypothetical protein [Candidatus Diapherotrites archaeon]
MEVAIEYKAVAVFLALLLAAVFLSSYWHTMPMNSIPIIAFSLEKFDQKAFQGQETCFTAGATPKFLTIENIKPLYAQVNGKAVAADMLAVYKDKAEKEYCFSSEFLEEGNNTVFVFLESERLFYHVELVQGERPEAFYGLELLDLNSDFVKFSFRGENLYSYEPIEIRVNGSIDHRVYPGNGGQVFLEGIETRPGSNQVEVVFREKTVSGNAERQERQAIPSLLGLAMLAGIVSCFALTIFSDKTVVEKFALAIALLFVLVILIGFGLNALNLLSLYSFIGLLLAASAAIGFYFRKNFRVSFQKVNVFSLHPLYYVVILVAIGTPLLFPVYSFSHYSYWNVFYERHSESLAENFSMPLFDELSYLGRGVSFIPGYFFLNAGLSWATGLGETALYSILLLLGNVLFMLSVFYFGESIGFSKKKSSILFLLLWLENFIRGALVISPRHAFSLALFLVALAYFIKNRKPLLSGVVLAFSSFIQAPMMLAFPVLYIIVGRKPEWKPLVKTLVVSAAIFLLLFLPNALNFGIVSQAEPQNWGYLIDYDFYSLFLDLGPLMVFFLLISLFDILGKESRLDSYSLKLLAAAVLGLLFQVYISYRWNIFNAINIAVLLALILPEKALKERNSSRYMAIILLISASMMVVGINMLSISTYSSTAYDFISESTSTQSRILSDPLFGHDITYICSRAVLSDLAVEYADQKKLSDTYEFLIGKDTEILCNYGISHTVNQADMVNRKAFGNELEETEIEFPELNKVFTNGFIFVHQVQKC